MSGDRTGEPSALPGPGSAADGRVVRLGEGEASVALTARQRFMLERARVDGRVMVEALAEHLDVTPQTVRRDLNHLCDLRLLQRIRGGATAASGVSNLGYAGRKRLAASEKAAIGRRAAALIPNDSSLFVNIGTTTEEVARHLAHHVGLLVITNNINVVNLLQPCPNIEVMVAGGIVRREDGGVVGDQAVDFIGQFRVDHAVVGASAIDDDGTLLDYDPREVRVARAIISNARSVIVVADAMKFERTAPVRIADIAQVDWFVTDREPPPRFAEICAQHGVRIEIAGRP
ncbi:MAG: DeoR/GlpR transcriptional regulator [Ectothiorhodospiraceae bacterium]|nr:DeoR/GlpR transcriptional regulator [Ectothiorhodospiraceae bacterium]